MFKIQDHRCLPSIPTKTKSFSEKSASRFQSMSFSTTRSTLTNLTTATPPPVVVGLSTSAISSVANSRSSQPSVLTPTRPSNHSHNTRSRGRDTGRNVEHLLARSGAVALQVSNDDSNKIDFIDIYNTTPASTNDDVADLIPAPSEPLP